MVMDIEEEFMRLNLRLELNRSRLKELGNGHRQGYGRMWYNVAHIMPHQFAPLAKP